MSDFALLNWVEKEGYREALLGKDGDGVVFSLQFQISCYRRGQWKLMIGVLAGKYHLYWGCLDEQDQPLRYYHNEECALREAESIAQVLMKDRMCSGVTHG